MKKYISPIAKTIYLDEEAPLMDVSITTCNEVNEGEDLSNRREGSPIWGDAPLVTGE